MLVMNTFLEGENFHPRPSKTDVKNRSTRHRRGLGIPSSSWFPEKTLASHFPVDPKKSLQFVRPSQNRKGLKTSMTIFRFQKPAFSHFR